MPVCADLATKAQLTKLEDEVQELRDQLNGVLGEKEEGGTEEIFRAGVPVASSLLQSAATIYGVTKLRAAQAITDIKLAGQINNVTHVNFAKGTTTIQAVKGGVASNVVPLNSVAKIAGQNTAAASLSAKLGLTGAAGVGLLANLVSIAGSLAINIATVNVLDKRIEAEADGARLQIDAVNNSMIRLYDKHQGNINEINKTLSKNQDSLDENRANIEQTRADILEAQKNNKKLNQDIKAANDSISALQSQNQNIVDEINASNIETQEIIDNLIAQSNVVESEIAQAIEIIKKHEETIKKQQERIELLEGRIETLESRILSVELSFIHLREDFRKLQIQLGIDPDAITEESKLAEFALIQRFVTQPTTAAGGSAASNAGSVAKTQNGVLELASKLTGVDQNIENITATDVVNSPNIFTDTLENLLTQITPGDDVNQQQLDDLRTGIGADITNLQSFFNGNVVPKLDTIQNQTRHLSLVGASKDAICQSLNGNGSCPVTPGNPNPTQGLGGLQKALSGKMDQVNASLNATAIAQNQAIKTVVESTNSIVKNTTYGLEAAHKLADTAWKATHADKILAATTTVLAIHNGMMLSNNLLSTISEATNVTLDALGIKDSTDAPIDIGAAVRGKIQGVLTNLIGAEAYTALTARIARANRIYQSSINALNTTQSLFDSARTVAELTAENTGKIGNALKESGAVYEDAYNDFVEEVNPQSAAMRKLDKFREGLESIENVVDTVSQVSGEVVEIQENYDQLKKEKKEWKEEVDQALAAKAETKAEAKSAVQVTASIDAIDFEADESTS